MNSQTSFSTVLEKPIGRVWDTVRDFNSYPVWVDGVTHSHIEGDLPGTTIGACDSMELDDEAGRTRTLHAYEGSLALRTVDDGDRCFAEWSTAYECPEADEAFWSEWWGTAVPGWLGSLRKHLDRE